MNTKLVVNKLVLGHKPEVPYTEEEYVALCDTVSGDISNIYKYIEYGFTFFNFKWAFITQLPYINDKDKENIRNMIDSLNERLNRLREDIF